MSNDFDIAIAGSGFAGSLFAVIARRLGRSVVLLEKQAHPRFAIGESTAPLANLLLEELCDRYALDRIRPLCAWGSWQRTYPRIAGGLKRGFTFYGHRASEPFRADPWRRDQLLVAASPRDEVADTHWYRADVDEFLVGQAQSEGVRYLDRVRLEGMEADGNGVRLEGTRNGESLKISARLLVDASGPRGFTHRALGLQDTRFSDLPLTEVLYSHFTGVRRLIDTPAFSFGSGGRPPFPPDDAAVHHVFEGGWVWVLRFSNGLVSAGVAAEPELAFDLQLSDGAPAWARLLALFPSLRDQFAGSAAIRPFSHAITVPFRTARASGPGWVLLPSAAAFVDPMLSTGFPLALLGIDRVASAIETHWGRPGLEPALAAHADATLEEADTAGRLVAALYAAFGDFELFAALTLLYFAAASYAEAARRLSRASLSGAFLSADHPTFGAALRQCCEAVVEAKARGALAAERTGLIESVYRAIEPLDVAGLSDRSRNNWHPAQGKTLLDAAHKLGATRRDVEAMLVATGFVTDGARPTRPDADRLRPPAAASEPAPPRPRFAP